MKTLKQLWLIIVYLINKRILVIANFGKDTATVPVEYSFKHIILSNKGRSSLPTTSISLESCEVLVLECDN